MSKKKLKKIWEEQRAKEEELEELEEDEEL